MRNRIDIPTPMPRRKINQIYISSVKAKQKIEPLQSIRAAHSIFPAPNVWESLGTSGEKNKKARAGSAPIYPITSLPIPRRSRAKDTSGIERLRDRPITVTAAMIAIMVLVLF